LASFTCIAAKIVGGLASCQRFVQGKPSATVQDLRARVEYLELEASRLAALVRQLVGPVFNDLPLARQTWASFDYQWEKLPPGRYNLENQDFRQEAADYVCQFTDLAPGWFSGKSVIDVGCGAGRYSWAMSTLGANVLSLDQSEHGLRRCAEACRDFPAHRTKVANLLAPLDIDEQFDLVWSFGVLHHTGNTWAAYRNIVPLVKPGGLLFMMIYGEPRHGILSDYLQVNEYERWRRRTRNMKFDERLATVQSAMDREEFLVSGPLHVEGYFDAISPLVADLYSWEELESWLIGDGFVDIKRTLDTRNHHVIARRPA